MNFELPRPGPAHERLLRLVGEWSGPETIAPSPWAPAGEAVAQSSYRASLDGLALVQDYEQRKGDQSGFKGHGVMMIEPGSDTVLWWWFDSAGFPPEPARGRWDGDVLHLHKRTARGEARYRYELSGDRLRFVIENRFPGQADFSLFLSADYTR